MIYSAIGLRHIFPWQIKSILTQTPPAVFLHHITHVTVLVHRARQRDTRLLSTTQVDALLADLRRVARGQDGDIRLQTARLQHLLRLTPHPLTHLVLVRVERAAEQDVVAQTGIHDERRLRHVADAALNLHHVVDRARRVQLRHLAQNRVQQRRLA